MGVFFKKVPRPAVKTENSHDTSIRKFPGGSETTSNGGPKSWGVPKKWWGPGARKKLGVLKSYFRGSKNGGTGSPYKNCRGKK